VQSTDKELQINRNQPPVDFLELETPVRKPDPWELGPPPGFDEDTRRAVKKAVVAPVTESLLFGPAIAEPLPPIEYIIREIGLVGGSGAPHLFAGYGFSGKTLALQALALSLAGGHAVWGSYLVKPSRVVHVDFEQGHRLSCRRYQRLAFSMGVDLHEVGDALALAVMPKLSLSIQYRENWLAMMQGREVMILDSLRAATGGQEENSSEIRSALDLLGSLSEETGCRAIVIHHARKPSKDEKGGVFAIRGSSAIFDACDSAFVFSAEKNEPINVENVKARSHGELVDDFSLAISDEADEEGGDFKAGVRIQVHGVELIRDKRAERDRVAKKAAAERDAKVVRLAIIASPGASTSSLREATGLNAQRFAAARQSLGTEVQVKEEIVGKAWTNRHYLVTAGVEK
jgi:hypothetical protein